MPLPFELLPVAAFLGALAATSALYRIATRQGRTSIAIFLLGGLAIAALGNAGIGLLVYLADDRELRDITFWLLGSLSGATGQGGDDGVVLLAVLAALRFIARGLDLLVLGEAEAFHMGVEVERLKRASILLVAAADRRCGVGLRRHRLCRHHRSASAAARRSGPGHRLLLPASILLGAILLLCADTDRAHHRGARGVADRHRHRGDRRAVLPLPAAAPAFPGRPMTALSKPHRSR